MTILVISNSSYQNVMLQVYYCISRLNKGHNIVCLNYHLEVTGRSANAILAKTLAVISILLSDISATATLLYPIELIIRPV